MLNILAISILYKLYVFFKYSKKRFLFYLHFGLLIENVESYCLFLKRMKVFKFCHNSILVVLLPVKNNNTLKHTNFIISILIY